jgi:hypothetical protein
METRVLVAHSRTVVFAQDGTIIVVGFEVTLVAVIRQRAYLPQVDSA